MSNYVMSKTQYLRIQSYLYDLHQSGKVCVFVDFMGHVDWLTIRIAASKDDYNSVLYRDDIYTTVDYKPEETDKQMVDAIISAINKAIENQENKLHEIQKEREAAEKAKYEELKAKYEQV